VEASPLPDDRRQKHAALIAAGEFTARP
jgi:hypothetical protein